MKAVKCTHFASNYFITCNARLSKLYKLAKPAPKAMITPTNNPRKCVSIFCSELWGVNCMYEIFAILIDGRVVFVDIVEVVVAWTVSTWPVLTSLLSVTITVDIAVIVLILVPVVMRVVVDVVVECAVTSVGTLKIPAQAATSFPCSKGFFQHGSYKLYSCLGRNWILHLRLDSNAFSLWGLGYSNSHHRTHLQASISFRQLQFRRESWTSTSIRAANLFVSWVETM